MKTTSIRQSALAFAALSCICLFAASSASAVIVTWNLNPEFLNQEVGSTSHTFTQSGFSITAYGFTIAPSSDTPLGLFYKNQGFDETGLGVVGTSQNELEGLNSMPLQYIQLDLGSILSQGFTDGKLRIASVQSSSNDMFNFYGSNTLGTLGTKIAGTFDSSSDQIFLDIPNFGSFRFISIGAVSGDVLPQYFQAFVIPEMSALFPIVGLIAAVSFTQLLRRRRRAQLRTGSAPA